MHRPMCISLFWDWFKCCGSVEKEKNNSVLLLEQSDQSECNFNICIELISNLKISVNKLSTEKTSRILFHDSVGQSSKTDDENALNQMSSCHCFVLFFLIIKKDLNLKNL